MSPLPRPWGSSRLPPPAFSPSRLARHARCPRSYFYTHVLHRPEALDAPTQKGLNLHASLLGLHQAGWALPPEPRAAEALLEQHWATEGFADEAASRQALAEATALLVRYLEAPTRPAQVVLAEAELKASWGGRRWRGVLDRLDRRPEGLVVVDYKSGREPPPLAEQRLQLGLYAELVRHHLGEAPVGAELHHLPSGRAIPLDLGPEGWAGPLAEAEALAEALARDTRFEPKPGPACRRCGHRHHCPAAPPPASEGGPGQGPA